MKTLTNSKNQRNASRLCALNVLRVAAAVVIGETVTVAGDVYEADSGAGVTAGRTSVDVSAGGTKATGTLTSDNTNVSDGDTVVIGSKTYTFKTALTPTEGEVLIGADADASLLNLIRAINHTGTPNTHYKCAAANTQVTAAASVTSHAFAVTAIYTGTGGNSIASTDTAAHLSWGAATLASGASPTAEQFVDALITATVGASAYAAVKISANEVLFKMALPGNNTAAVSETLSGTNNAWSASAFYGGTDAPEGLRNLVAVKRTPNATEVTMQTMHFALGFNPVTAAVQIRSSDGVVSAFDGAVTISGNLVNVNSSGSTDIATGDLVTLIAAD